MGRTPVEIRIGIQHSPREIVIESDDAAEAVTETLRTCVDEGSTIAMKDARGRTVIVPGAKVAYIEVGSDEPRRVGFLG